MVAAAGAPVVVSVEVGFEEEIEVEEAGFEVVVAGSGNADTDADSNTDDGEEEATGLLPFCLALRAKMRVAAAALARTTSTAHRATPAVRPARIRPFSHASMSRTVHQSRSSMLASRRADDAENSAVAATVDEIDSGEEGVDDTGSKAEASEDDDGE